MRKQKNILIGICIGGILALIFTIVSIIANNLNTEEEVSVSNDSVKEIVYIEIPYIYYVDNMEINTEDELKRIAYEDYLDKLTEENAEHWWYGYKIMISDWEDQPEHITDVYSEEELEYLYSCVETEVFGGDFLSKAHVAMVIFNRIDDPEQIWGENIQEIITRPNQFAYGAHPISEQTKQACAFAFEIPDMTQGAVSFHSNEQTDTFNGREYIFTDAVGHHFY